MPPTTGCPAVAEYLQLLNGEASQAVVSQLAEHLETCDRCAAAVQTLLNEDTLGDSIREANRAPALAHLPPSLVSKLLSLTDSAQEPRLESFGTQPETGERPFAGDVTARVSVVGAGHGEITRIGGYQVLELLGEGGMGIVYLAEDSQLQRRVALKVMKPDLARIDTARQRFLTEARAAARIKSDHVVTIYQTGEDGGTVFAAMELLKGESLDSWLKSHGNAPMSELIRVGRETALGLAAAHDEGLIHRDIKPANIWVETGGRVKILDFGLARSVEGNVQLTNSGAVIGTPAYMSPEQGRGDRVDHLADLFSLGCVLHRMTTGQLPFKGNSVMSMLSALALETPTPVHQLNPAVPRQLSNLIARLLAKDASQRPQTARAVAEELQAILTDDISPKEPATLTYTPEHASAMPAKQSRRPLVFVAVAVMFLVVAAVAASQFVFTTNDGTLIVEVDDDADVRFKNGKLEIYDEKGVLKYTLAPSEKNKTLPPGKYLVKVVGADGVKIETDAFDMERKGKSYIRVKAINSTTIAPTLKKDPPPNADGTATAEEIIAAEWVLSKNGFVTIRIDGKDQVVNKTKTGTDIVELPKAKFAIVGLNLSPVNAPVLQVNDHDLRQLACLKQLESLNLGRQEQVTTAGLSHFAGCSKLKRLGIFATQIGGDGVPLLNKFQRLEQFQFNVGDSDKWAEGLAKIPTMREVHAYRSDLSDEGVKHLTKLPNLEIVTFSDLRITDSSLKSLTSCKSLRSVNLDSGLPVTDAGLVHLSKAPNLENLRILQLDVTDAALKEFANCKTLRTLDVRECKKVTLGEMQKLKQALPKCEITFERNPVLAPGVKQP
ncbi:MAG: protein kinase [Planctomycetes bacterium]|nr:protein kinase [Planctomycetota bacterium]